MSTDTNPLTNEQTLQEIESFARWWIENIGELDIDEETNRVELDLGALLHDLQQIKALADLLRARLSIKSQPRLILLRKPNGTLEAVSPFYDWRIGERSENYEKPLPERIKLLASRAEERLAEFHNQCEILEVQP